MEELLRGPEVWIALAFVTFIAVIAKRGYQRITGTLDSRSAAIKAELEQAAQLREEAQALLAGYERKQREALEEATEIVAHAKEEAERRAGQAEKDLEAALERRTALAEQQIGQAEAQALKEVREASVDLAVAATRRLMRESLDEKRADELIDQAIKEVSDKFH